MKIQISKIYMNKTWKYLFPMLKDYEDDVLMSLLNSINIVATGIGDFLLDRRLEQHIFVLINQESNPRIFNNLYNYIIDKEYFEDDYVFDNLATGCLHMIIFKLPKNVIPTFLDGRYSHLYTYTEKKRLFNKEDEVYNIINKHYDYKIKFIKQVKEEFGTVLEINEIGNRELDLPPKKQDEIFNYRN